MTWTSASGELAGAIDRAAEMDSEANLLARARTEPAAFEVLYLLHQRSIWRYLRHRTGDSHAADDLAAEVFLAFLRALPDFRTRGIGLRGWLYRVATRKVARWSRSAAARRSSGEPVEPVAGPERSGDARDRVRAALDELPQKFQAVLVLHHLEGLAVLEIAASLGVREGTVRSRLARGRERLKENLIRNGGAE